jgi:phenylalanyl-tRNA synthetase alpha chain
MEAGSRRLFATPENRTTKPRNYEQYFKDVQRVHQDGAFGSIGYRYPWSADETLRLVLRTHTTAVSTWVLHRLAEDPRPARYFSIDRVFRNETVDATHLAEFHQIEGVIADFGLTLGGLMKFLEDFFSKMGIEGLRFKPAYNPYTEPSMEIFGYHVGLGKWVEVSCSFLNFCTIDGGLFGENVWLTKNCRSATAACSGPRCWSPWAYPRICACMALVFRSSGRR